MEKSYKVEDCMSFGYFMVLVRAIVKNGTTEIVKENMEETVLSFVDDKELDAIDKFFQLCNENVWNDRGENIDVSSASLLKRQRVRAHRAYAEIKNLEYIVLEDCILYDNDDYGKYATTYYNIESGKVFCDRYGHGSYGKVTDENSLLYTYAIMLGFIDENVIREALYARYSEDMKDGVITADMVKSSKSSLFIPCKVVGGAKFKGDGYLLSYSETKSRYGYNNYDVKVKVYDPKSNEIKTVNSFDYLEFSDEVVAKVMEAVKEQRHEHCMQMDLFKLIHQMAYSISYSACDSRAYHSFLDDVSYIDLSKVFDAIDLSGAVDPEEEKKRKKNEEFKNNKIADLIAWAKSKGLHDGSEEELRTFAESIYARKYAYMM